MKTLPYFKWYPADAETDSNFSAMGDAEIGFFLRCLNYAWINGGIPADSAERARVLRTRKDTADKRWLRVGKCFETCQEDPSLLTNPRQEMERKLASEISQVRAESAKARSKCSANAQQNATEPMSMSMYSVSSLENLPKQKILERAREETGQHFEEFWRRYPRKVGRERALHAWCFCVTVDNEEQLFACLDSYLGSDEVARGKVMGAEKWICEANADGWASRWPAPQAVKIIPKSATERAIARAIEREKNGTN